MLINQGYPEATVHRFFAPLAQKNIDMVDKREESRRFYAYINRNGSLHNNGMVATAAFMSKLEHELGPRRLQRGTDGERKYVVLDLDDGGEPLPVGIRKLGLVQLKGLEKLMVFEIVDGSTLDSGSLRALPDQQLVNMIDREFSSAIAGG
jgi:hypothetical protein